MPDHFRQTAAPPRFAFHFDDEGTASRFPIVSFAAQSTGPRIERTLVASQKARTADAPTDSLPHPLLPHDSPFSAPGEDPKSVLRLRIQSFLCLPNLAGYDFAGNPVLNPSEETVKEALRFLDLLPPRIPMPIVGRADDGEINFFWRRTGVFIDVGFYGDGNLYYLARIEASDLDRDGMEPIRAPVLPRDLIVALAAVDP